MPVTDVHQDLDARSLTITAQFAAPVERVWQVYADPRQLEQIWGPPAAPATFVDHCLEPGGRMTYYMTSSDGDKFCGYWEITSVDEPSGFTFLDGFANEDLSNNPDLPVSTNVYTFTAHEGGTRAVYLSTFDTVEGLQQVLDMGVIEGATRAINQIDGFLAE